MRSLSKTLQAPVPAEFATLSDDDLRALEHALAAAATARSQALTEAVDASLKHLPFVLRPAVKKALGL